MRSAALSLNKNTERIEPFFPTQLTLKRKGLMLALSSPSGAGKTSIARGLLEKDKDLYLSVSMTTRPKRSREEEGKDYFFVNKENFDKNIRENAFLEYAYIFGQYYGTPRKFVEDKLSKGKDILFDIDWQGVQQLYHQAGKDLVRVFILPPSYKELENRLQIRNQDSAEVIKERMDQSYEEIRQWPTYDYLIVNEDLEESINKVHAILIAERLKRFRQEGVEEFIRMS